MGVRAVAVSLGVSGPERRPLSSSDRIKEK